MWTLSSDYTKHMISDGFKGNVQPVFNALSIYRNVNNI